MVPILFGQALVPCTSGGMQPILYQKLAPYPIMVYYGIFFQFFPFSATSKRETKWYMGYAIPHETVLFQHLLVFGLILFPICLPFQGFNMSRTATLI